VSLAKACRFFGITPQAVYQQLKRQQQRRTTLAPVEGMVHDIRRRLPRLGTRKLHYLLKPQLESLGIKLGRDGLFDYLRQRKMLIRPKRSYIKTTYSKHWMKKHPNLMKDLKLSRPEQAFVSDITYVESEEGVHYLSLVTDGYSRRIMGHELSYEMKASDTAQAMHQAISNRVTDKALLHHSDRGSQYCSSLYQSLLKANNVTPSMTDGYDCYQNAMEERVNGILKQEFLLYRCKSFDDLKRLVAESIEAYNQLRPHLSLGMQTPEEVHKKASGKMQLAHS